MPNREAVARATAETIFRYVTDQPGGDPDVDHLTTIILAAMDKAVAIDPVVRRLVVPDGKGGFTCDWGDVVANIHQLNTSLETIGRENRELFRHNEELTAKLELTGEAVITVGITVGVSKPWRELVSRRAYNLIRETAFAAMEREDADETDYKSLLRTLSKQQDNMAARGADVKWTSVIGSAIGAIRSLMRERSNLQRRIAQSDAGLAEHICKCVKVIGPNGQMILSPAPIERAISSYRGRPKEDKDACQVFDQFVDHETPNVSDKEYPNPTVAILAVACAAADSLPVETFHPGEYIKDELRERGWSRDDFIEKTGLKQIVVEALFDGKIHITHSMAEAIGKAFGTSTGLWLNLDKAYCAALRDAEKEG